MLFSDGEDHGSDEATAVAAGAAENAGVHIETVGVGTTAGTTVTVDKYRVHTALDEDTLTAIAKTTGGSYHPASDAAELDGIASTIDLRLTTHREDLPLAGAVTGVAVLLLAVGAVLTVLRTGGWSDVVHVAVGPAGAAGRPARARRRLVVPAPPAPRRRPGHLGRARPRGAAGPVLWRRRIPAALFGAGLAVLGVGAARPQATVAVPSNSTTILLAIDVSGSMCSTDVQPNRLTAAEKAAAEFITAQPGGTRIGLVAFPGSPASWSRRPTTRRAAGRADRACDLPRHRDRPGDPDLDRRDRGDRPGGAADRGGRDRRARRRTAYVRPTPSSCSPTARTPRASTRRPRPKQAAARRLRVYTIGFGTTTPAPMVCDSPQIGDAPGGGPFGGGGGRSAAAVRRRRPQPAGRRRRRAPAGRRRCTGGQFYGAKDAGQLQSALADLPRAITVTHEHRDLAAWFAGIGGLLIAVAVALSLWWNRVRRVPAGGAAAGGDPTSAP